MNFVYSTARWLSVGLGEKLHLIFLSLEKRVSGKKIRGDGCSRVVLSQKMELLAIFVIKSWVIRSKFKQLKIGIAYALST